MPDNSTRIWTIRELMKSAIEHLQKQGMDDARLNVELLLAHALDLQRIQLYTNFDKPLTAEEVGRFRGLFERRLKREPVQYIIGSVNFMGMHFDVDPRVLIPRPETETLIEQIILFSRRYQENETIRMLEIGTGSGNIAIAAAKFVKNAQVQAIDISPDAIAVAKKNAHLHQVDSRIDFICADIFESLEQPFQTKYNLVVSNPPYVSNDEWENLQPEIKNFEPLVAVTDGKDGFKFYRRIIEIVPEYVEPGGGLILEVGIDQAEEVLRLLENAGLKQVQITPDMQGVPRVVSGTWTGGNELTIGLN
jgi:release factor glutamine methyltransferase